ncbi:GNAT family N-acetyltransferase [Ktedonospora formicarum]|uniref:Alanine acetyltransferase n=1 Tax=Ktedonospora formicarum TaxID=2778364 RepID=A0A8J3MQB8_9CHLR|nr:GNAT family protein [Ktedonospora formicarum]GHO43825.1 alanine acetyltransferase [Ktedonospora formicarum]
MIRGEKIILRAIMRDDLSQLEIWHQDPEFLGQFNNFGLRGQGGMTCSFEEDGMLSDRSGHLVVTTLEGTLVGDVDYHKVGYGPNEGSKPYMIGIGLHPDHQGKGYGTEAQRLLAAYLFATYPIMRVEAMTDITNLAEQKSLEKAGFTRECVLRKAQWRAGAHHDQVLYSKLRGE